MGQKYRISQLSDLAGRAFLELDIGQNSARVRQVPDVRTIRYYTTLGLIDRPAEMKGRTAFYENGHLMQLIAIKRLQSEGKSLVEVQQHMTAIDEKQLKELAAVPRGFFRKVDHWLTEQPEQSADTAAPAAEKAVRRRKASTRKAPDRGKFWAETPAIPKADSEAQGIEHSIDVRPSTVLRLTHNVSLHIDGVTDDRLDDDTVSLLEPVLKELTAILQSAGLTASQDSINGDNNDTQTANA